MNGPSCSGPLGMVQRAAQFRHAPTGACASGRGADAQHSADLIETETPLVVKQQSFGLIRSQTRKTSADLIQRAKAFYLREDRDLRQVLTNIMNLRPSPRGAPIHQKDVSCQTEDPGFHRVRRVVCSPRPVHLKERLLEEIVSHLG